MTTKRRDRYTVGSVTGYAIASTRNANPTTLWYIHDSAYGYRILREFQGRLAEAKARALASQLNGKPLDLPSGPDAPRCRHGHVYDAANVYITSIGSWQCRACRATHRQRHRELAPRKRKARA